MQPLHLYFEVSLPSCGTSAGWCVSGFYYLGWPVRISQPPLSLLINIQNPLYLVGGCRCEPWTHLPPPPPPALQTGPPAGPSFSQVSGFPIVLWRPLDKGGWSTYVNLCLDIKGNGTSVNGD